jgi:hypothetical protein
MCSNQLKTSGVKASEVFFSHSCDLNLSIATHRRHRISPNGKTLEVSASIAETKPTHKASKTIDPSAF